MSWMVWVAETFGQISIFLLVNYFLGQNIWNPINPNTEIVSRTKYGSFQLIVKWTSPFRPTIYINLHLNPHNFKFIQFCWIIATENRSPYIDIKRYKHEIDLSECGNNRHTGKYLLVLSTSPSLMWNIGTWQKCCCFAFTRTLLLHSTGEQARASLFRCVFSRYRFSFYRIVCFVLNTHKSCIAGIV